MSAQADGALSSSSTSHRPRSPLNLMGHSTASVDELRDIPLQNRMIISLKWLDAGDRLGIRVQPSQRDCYMLNKKAACSESSYLRSCYTSSTDLHPKVTARLIHRRPQDEFSWVFVIMWLRKCRRIRVGLNAAEEQPEISVKEWCEKQRRITFLEWSQIYCLAEALDMPRLKEHVRVAAEVKATRTKRLPLCDAVNHLYDHGSRFSALKNVFIDMYAIAALRCEGIFGDEWNLYPEVFVSDVCTYSKPKAYIERRKALKECMPRPPDRDEDDEDDVGSDEESDDDDKE